MKVIVVGLGNLGTGVSKQLNKKGHKVIAIDLLPEKKKMLGEQFKGMFLTGSGMHKHVLEEADILTADALVACTQSDEINAVLARVAKNIYSVPKVVARLYDARKAQIYEHLGIQVISPSNWGIERVSELLTVHQLDSVYTMGNGHVNLVRIEVPVLLVGRNVKDISREGELNVVSITRNNKTFIPTLGSVLQEEDSLYLSVGDTAKEYLKSMFGIG